jgi:DNA-binding CsgD family transcriptional regulator
MLRILKVAAAVAGVAAVLTLLLAGLEAATGEPPSGLGEFAVEFVEALILVSAMFGSATVILRLREVRSRADALEADVRAAAAAGAEWRRQSQLLLRGLGDAVDAQFRAWGLSPAEAEVAGLVLKGMSSKEIARARATSEATVRQQAQAVYRKSGLSGRAEFAAYFLEDVFEAGRDRLGDPPQGPLA